MHYLLHAPNRYDVFATNSSSVVRFMRHRHNWTGIKTDCDEAPEYVSTLSICALDDGAVMIDENVVDNGRYILEQMRGFSRRDRFGEVDMHYVGRLNRDSRI